MSLDSPQFSVSTQDLNLWHERVAEWARTAGQEILATVRDECRLLMDRVINGYTGGSGRGVATPPDTREQGKKAVARDIRKSVVLLKPEHFEDRVPSRNRFRSIRKAIRSRDYQTLRVVAEKGGLGPRFRSAYLGRFAPEWHQEQRNPKTGRVKRQAFKYATADGEAVTSYIRKVQEDVGRAKGGWAAAFAALGGRPSDWISRHSAEGVYEENYRSQGSSVIWEFEAENFSSWATHDEEAHRMVEGAIRSREEAVRLKVENYVKHVLPGTQ